MDQRDRKDSLDHPFHLERWNRSQLKKERRPLRPLLVGNSESLKAENMFKIRGELICFAIILLFGASSWSSIMGGNCRIGQFKIRESLTVFIKIKPLNLN
jgi:hypothetical protein